MSSRIPRKTPPDSPLKKAPRARSTAPGADKKRLPRSKSVPKSTFAFSLAPPPPPLKKGEKHIKYYFFKIVGRKELLVGFLNICWYFMLGFCNKFRRSGLETLILILQS